MTGVRYASRVASAVVAATSSLAASSPTGAALTAGAVYLFVRFRR